MSGERALLQALSMSAWTQLRYFCPLAPRVVPAQPISQELRKVFRTCAWVQNGRRGIVSCYRFTQHSNNQAS